MSQSEMYETSATACRGNETTSNKFDLIVVHSKRPITGSEDASAPMLSPAQVVSGVGIVNRANTAMATNESGESNDVYNKGFDQPRMNAAEHSRYARHPRKIAFRLLAQNYNLVTALGYPCIVLDAGCGTGDSSKLLSYFANVSEILALDESAEMLAVAETFNNDERIVYDLTDLGTYFRLPESASDGFDLVCSFDTLHWMKEPLRGLAVLARSVRIGGLLIGFALASTPKSYERIRPLLSEKVMLPNAPWFTDDEPEQSMGEALENIGFEVISCNLEEDRMIYTKEEAMGALMMLKNIFPSSMAEEEMTRIIDAYLNSFDRLPNGTYVERTRILIFVGRKVCNV